MSYLFLSVLLGYPVEYTPASVIIEVDVNIGQGDTVGVQESLEQQVIFYRVYARDSECVGDNTTGSRTTSGAY